MGSMVAPAPLPPREPYAPGDQDAIFTSLVESNPPPRRGGKSFPISFAIHTLVVLAVFVLPLYWSDALPAYEDSSHIFFWSPPAAVAAPLPKGHEEGQTPKPRATPDPNRVPDKVPTLVEPTVEVPPDKPPDQTPAIDVAGDPNGSDNGTPDGMKGGQDGGLVGGCVGEGCVPGGCIGCDGNGKADPHPEESPRLITQVKPTYPQEAFIKKIEGTVIVEGVIDGTGRVVNPRVVKSIPVLDAAAIACVKLWVFAPGRHHGVPVATLGRFPIQFRIY
jgi:protein TonB